MAHGMADFGMYAPKQTTFNLADLADLAVRLGSIVEYDRRGDVIVLDDCESPIIKPYKYSSAGGDVILSSEAAISKAQSINLITPATANRYAFIQYNPRPIITGKHGAKLSCNFYGMGDIDGWFWIEQYMVSLTRDYYAGIRIHLKDQTLEYRDSGGTYQTFATGVRLNDAAKQIFHDFKLVIDLDTRKYVRFLLDMAEWDLSAYDFASDEVAGELEDLVQFQVRTLEDTAIDILVDDFVYTINEL